MSIHQAVQAAQSASAPVSADIRGSTRQRTLFVIGKLMKKDCAHVCRVRNISDGGVGIEHDTTLAAGDGVTIEMRGLSPAPAVVRWTEDRQAGLEFCEQVELERWYDDAGRTQGQVPRSPRFAVARTATLQVEERRLDVRVLDVALGGIKIEASHGLTVGRAVRVVLHDHEVILTALVCWTSAATAGLRLARPLSTRELILLLDQRHPDDAAI